MAVRQITSSFLRDLHRASKLPVSSFSIAATTTLSVLNRPDNLQQALEAVNCIGNESASMAAQERAIVFRQVREALIKSSAIIGLPKTINSLLSLKKCTPEECLDFPMGRSPSGRPADVFDVEQSRILHRGQTFFNTVYGKISKRVMGQMDRCGTEDLGLVARLFYGHVLSNTRILSPAECSLVLIAALIPQDVNPQLKGHLKGAINNGASLDDVRAVRNLAIEICIAAGMKRLSESDRHSWGWSTEPATI